MGNGGVMPVAFVVAWLKMYMLILQAETTVSAILSMYTSQVVSSKVQRHQKLLTTISLLLKDRVCTCHATHSYICGQFTRGR